MRSPQARARRRQEVKERASDPSSFFSRCRIVGCTRTARAGTEDGLDRSYCRVHGEHLSRHGNVTKPSYTAIELAPYRRAALAWLKVHAEEQRVRQALHKVIDLYHLAGPAVEAFRRRGMTPEERARAHWAQLRKRDVAPALVVAAALAVEMRHADDPHPASKAEYRHVQAAKLVHRQAGGTRKQWERQVVEVTPFGPKTVSALEKLIAHPRSRGRVLRHLGEAVMSAVESLVEHHLADLQAFKREREAARRATA